MNYQKMKMGYLYHCLTLFCCLTENVTFDTSELADVSSLSKLCPYTDYCTSNASKRLQDSTEAPCCGYCSCADDCWKRGNCCVDKQTIITEQPTEPCDAVLVSHPGNKYFYNNLPGYYITKSCPTRDDPLEEKCSGRRQPSIEDFIWVTDSRTHRIYNNKYCARCHGVNAYTPWFISTDCMEVLTGQNSPIDTINHIISNCSLFVAPTSIKDHKSRCFVPKITQCNMTGKAETYNQALESACNSFSQPYVEARFNRPPIYKNVYCFLCNWQHDLIVPDICMSDDTADRSGFAGFTGIIDFTAIETVDKAVAHEAQGPGRACAIDEIGDPYQVLNKLENLS